MPRIFIIIAMIFLSGCSFLPKSGPQIDPIFIHKVDTSNSSSQPTGTFSATVTSAIQAEQIPVFEYYAALSTARSISTTKTISLVTSTGETTTTTNIKNAVDNYVDAGITLVNSYCLRWFQELSEQDIKKSFADANMNVIRALGTALLGLGKANSIFVTGYGASNTAYEGVSKNYGDAFLLAPNSRKVKAQILTLLDARADELTGTKKPQTFAQAYRELERFADLCTHATAKEVVNNALDQANASADKGGKITLTPTSTALANASGQVAALAAKAETDKKAMEEIRQNLESKILDIEKRATQNTEAKTQSDSVISNIKKEIEKLKNQLEETKPKLDSTIKTTQ